MPLALSFSALSTSPTVPPAVSTMSAPFVYERSGDGMRTFTAMGLPSIVGTADERGSNRSTSADPRSSAVSLLLFQFKRRLGGQLFQIHRQVLQRGRAVDAA